MRTAALLRCPGCRYQPPGSHEGLVDGLLVEGRLRMRIAELQAHRAAGRRTMAEVGGWRCGKQWDYVYVHCRRCLLRECSTTVTFKSHVSNQAGLT